MNHKLRTQHAVDMRPLMVALVMIFTLALPSCIDVAPEEVVAYSDYYAGVDDADAAILGLYGQFMGLAEQVVVLNELRADLMDVTDNATPELEEINRNIPSKNNAWANVSKFYGVIQSCNDILHNYDLMLAGNKLTQREYDERYSDVAALRTWVYLQLSTLYGSVPYITEPIIALEDLDKYKSNVKSPKELIPELIRCMESLPTLENYRLSKLISGTIDGYSLVPFFINKKCLLGDLYLYNDEYEKAARIYRDVLSVAEDAVAGTDWNQDRKYRIYSFVWTTSSPPDWFSIVYERWRDDDKEAFYNGWRNMFLARSGSNDRVYLQEMIWFVSYDTKFAPTYTLSQLFDPVTNNNGKYYLKPSIYAVDSVWGGQTQKNSFPYDARGLTGSFDEYAGNYYVRKYSYFENTGDVCGDWFLYRAAMLHLRYAEAANRAGYPLLAWALVNDGLGNGSSAFTFKRPPEYEEDFPSDSIHQSGYGPGQPYPAPWYFDGRQSDAPYIRAPWRNNAGIRGRANLPNVPFPTGLATLQDSILWVEKLIIKEAALELGFEGNRWGDLVRVARRLNKESAGAGTRFLWDENIKKKFDRSGLTPPDMSSEEKWYLPVYE